jgi:adenine C2-methylase RlmN of 23S rRNA A2503 and tRNA A37
MEKNRQNIRHVEVADIERFIEKVGERSFRVKQIVEWLWKKHAHSFDEMTDLSKDLRKQLVDHFTLPALYTLKSRTVCTIDNKSFLIVFIDTSVVIFFQIQ